MSDLPWSDVEACPWPPFLSQQTCHWPSTHRNGVFGLEPTSRQALGCVGCPCQYSVARQLEKSAVALEGLARASPRLNKGQGRENNLVLEGRPPTFEPMPDSSLERFGIAELHRHRP